MCDALVLQAAASKSTLGSSLIVVHLIVVHLLAVAYPAQSDPGSHLCKACTIHYSSTLCRKGLVARICGKEFAALLERST